MAVAPPPQMNQQSWDYLLGFTLTHEAMVLHMYNNRTQDGGDQDVTCGIGIRLDSANDCLAASIRDMFYDPDTMQGPSDDQLKADWQQAADTLRVGNVTPDHLIPEYAAVCQLRMWPDKVQDRMAQVIKDKLAQDLPRCQVELANFNQFPVQAQIACASFNYGYFISVTVHMKAALAAWDFDTAGRESWLKGLSSRKVLAHRTLFWNAARIVEQNRDFNELPLGNDPPSLIPWQPMGTGLPRMPDTEK